MIRASQKLWGKKATDVAIAGWTVTGRSQCKGRKV